MSQNMSQNVSSKTKTSEQPCYSISEITKMIQDSLESHFSLPLQIKGEISNFSSHASGHWYFSLKDEFSQIKVAMFKVANQKMTWKPNREQSVEVRIIGKLSVYKPRGEYQIICYSMEKCGQGAEEFERLKKKLQEEGLFERKKELPFLPQHIVIISSSTGAAIRDILNILKRRYKGVRVTLVPALVQGAEAPNSLIEALKKAEQIEDADVLILTRGGGSQDDLWAFNNEALARTLFLFPKPIISAIGHEIDFTMCDFIADVRAPTPSAAAEIVVKNVPDLVEKISQLKHQLYQNFKREIKYLKQKVTHLKKALIHPLKKIQEGEQRLDELNHQLIKEFQRGIQLREQKLKNLCAMLESLSPLKILSRGYCVVTKKDKLIKKAQDLKTGEEVHIQFSKSFALANITKTNSLYQKKEEQQKFYFAPHKKTTP